MTLDPSPHATQNAGSDDDQEARDAGIDPESYRYWKRAVAALPPMTPEEIAAVGPCCAVSTPTCPARPSNRHGNPIHTLPLVNN